MRRLVDIMEHAARKALDSDGIEELTETRADLETAYDMVADLMETNPHWRTAALAKCMTDLQALRFIVNRELRKRSLENRPKP